MADPVAFESYCDELLGAAVFDDYCPNGLQVDSGGGEVKRLISGVTASQALINAAVEADADLLLVHHGFFWKGEQQTLTGFKGKRIATLIRNHISLLVYHLPLDAHPQLGNNRRLGELLGVVGAEPLKEGGLVWQGGLASAESPIEVGRRIALALGREPLHIDGDNGDIHRLGWCTGAAQGAIEEAAAAGLDAFVSGEVSESTVHLARELGIHYFSAGHHATERSGVQALGNHLAEQFAVEHRFIDIPNPV
ncbi:MAG: Nif3-like dinuclear metal center hexameric protein [Candidatus Sedimenticola sp. (ex Thyasira tokunagai)]